MALALAWWLEAPAWGLAVAAALWAAAALTRGITALLLLLAAPLVLTAATPARSIDLALVGALGVAILGALPLLRTLGPTLPRPRAYAIAGGAIGVALLFLLTPPGGVLLASDLVTGTIVVSLLAGLLTFSSIPP